jgi:hypothetical protein
MFNELNKKWKIYLKRIANQNKSTYGDGGINCCELKDITSSKDAQSK